MILLVYFVVVVPDPGTIAEEAARRRIAGRVGSPGPPVGAVAIRARRPSSNRSFSHLSPFLIPACRGTRGYDRGSRGGMSRGGFDRGGRSRVQHSYQPSSTVFSDPWGARPGE
jgi:hypothetical protein